MKEIKLSFKLSIVLNQSDIHWVEEKLLRMREELFLEILEKVISEIEKKALKEQSKCDICGSALVKNGSEKRKIKTLVGEIAVSRVRMRCQKCKLDIYPFDNAIGLAPSKHDTLGVREISLWAATEVSYEKSSAFLKKFAGLEVSRKKIHQMALEEGKVIERWHEKRRASVFDEGKFAEDVGSKAPDVLYIQVDGTGINDRGSREWMECKVGASYSKRVPISKNRIWLMDKKSYAAIEDVDAFGQKFFLNCVSQGVLSAKKVIFIADGDRWIRRLKKDYFPDAIGVLDPWHLQRLLKVTLGEEKYDLVESSMSAAFAGDGVKIINLLSKELKEISDPEKKEKVASVIKYVRSNLDWIANIPKVDCAGSGPVEKTVDITVARRFKKRGMSWYKGGANPLIKLRLLKLNGEWDEYWQERKKELSRNAA
jgi:hypothetical protein